TMITRTPHADTAASDALRTNGVSGRPGGENEPIDGTVKIQIRGVYKVFGRRQDDALALLRQGADKSSVQAETGTNVGLAGVDADIPTGQVTCIMGLSGSGKSTLVRHLNRLIDPSAG